MDKASIYSQEASLLACYPDPRGCYSRLQELAGMGVEQVCTRGHVALPGGVGALGKGHSSTVFAAVYRGVYTAVKSRRPQGRRFSLAGEARLLSIASRAGVAPRVYAWSHDFIVMEYLPGPSLADLLDNTRSLPGWAVRGLLEAAATLDLAGVLHHELHRPWWNIFYTPTPSPRAVVVDFDSASIGCGNLAKAASALVHLGLLSVEPGLRRVLAWYKKECSVEGVGIALSSIYDLLSLAV